MNEGERSLLIVDDYQSPALARAEHGAAADILLLGKSSEWFSQRYDTRTRPLRFIDVGPFADRAHKAVAAFLVECIRRLPEQDLGGTTLAQLLDDPEASVWWYLEIVEKGPYRGPLVGQLYQVAIVDEAVRSGGYRVIHFSVRDAALAEVFRACAASRSDWMEWPARAPLPIPFAERHPAVMHGVRCVAALVRLIAARAIASRLRPDRGGAPDWQHRPVVFTMFPAWWKGIRTGQPSERFFEAPESGGVAGYLAWCTSLRALCRNVKPIREAFVRRDIRPLQSWSRCRDISFSGIRRCFRFERRLRRHIRARLGPFDVSALMGAELSRSLASGEPVQNRALARAVTRAIAATQPSSVLYRMEWQPSENALLVGLHRAGACGIGFLHYPFGERYLSMRFSDGELGAALAGIPGRTRPVPAGVIANGSALREHLASEGYPAERIALCGPQRYPRLAGLTPRPRDMIRRELGLSPRDLVLFVAPAIVSSETEALCAAIMLAADDGPLRLIIRPHPNQPHMGEALTALIARVGADRAGPMPAAADPYDYIAAADVLVGVGSMIAFEAMALGTMPIVFENRSTYAATSLAEYAEGLFVVSNGRELRHALASVKAKDEAAETKRETWPRLLQRVIGDLHRPPGVQLTDALSELAPFTKEPDVVHSPVSE
jgi:hypothetical protein